MLDYSDFSSYQDLERWCDENRYQIVNAETIMDENGYMTCFRVWYLKDRNVSGIDK